MLKAYTQPGEKVKVPDFRGLKMDAIEDFASETGVDAVIIDSIFDPRGNKGVVLGQDPQPNSEVKAGRTIYLTVSSLRPQMIKMPKLLEMNVKMAQSTLETYGLKMGKIRYVEGLPHVLRVTFNGRDIEPGTMIEKGSTLDVFVGKGITLKDVLMPDLIGLSRDEAANKLQSLGLMLGATIWPDNLTSAEDSALAIIYKMDPPFADSLLIKEGKRIDIYLRRSVEDAVVPSDTAPRIPLEPDPVLEQNNQQTNPEDNY